MWMNDPNGMVWFDGEYHLFYQHYPDSNVWGPMHWGHAVSTDLTHWQHLPIALYPDSLGYIFSGSAVVDADNTAGFGDSTMVAIFTHHDMEGERTGSNDFQYQSIAYSIDRGRSWTKYAGNPVVENPGIRDFRDPKVTWDAARKQWVMVFAAYDHVKIYTSPNLRDWTHRSDFGKTLGSHGGVWECPDLFPMTGDDGEEYWVLLVSVQAGSPNGGTGAQYFVGSFDGERFSVDAELQNLLETKKDTTLWLDYGRDNYAGVTWSNVPDGRTLFLGWMSNWQYAQVVPTTRWRSAMTLPRELELITTSTGMRLRIVPARELEKLRGQRWQLDETLPLEGAHLLPLAGTGIDPGQSEVWLEFGPDLPDSGSYGLRLSNATGEEIILGYDADRQRYFTDRIQSGPTDFQEDFATRRHYAPALSGVVPSLFRVFFDRSSVELFTDNGRLVMTDIFFPTQPFDQLVLFSDHPATVREMEVWNLPSVW